ncbi:MAG: hypothetical protein NTW08_01500 [Gammaproteobacteria bacterium]|nr:hypothetical protein [Gammaproteobacteria bacterium]
MHSIMGPYLVIKDQKPNCWLSWSMEGEVLKNVFIADIEHQTNDCVWQKREQSKTAEYFYLESTCFIFNNSQVYRVSASTQSQVKQIERLQFNGTLWFYAVDPTASHFIPAPNPDIALVSFSKRKILPPPRDLPEQLPATSLIEDEVISALDIEGLREHLNAPRCYLLKYKPARLKTGKLSIWLEDGAYHYGWRINRYSLTGMVNIEDNQALIEFLTSYQPKDPVEKLHRVLKTQNLGLLQHLKASCLGLSTNQQRLIIGRLVSDGIWPENDVVSDPQQLRDLLLAFLIAQEENKLSPQLETLCDDFHTFIEPEQLFLIDQVDRFYLSTDPMASIAEKANVRHVQQFIFYIVLTALHALNQKAGRFSTLYCTEEMEARRIGEDLTDKIAADQASDLPHGERILYQILCGLVDVENLILADLKETERTLKLILNLNASVEPISSQLLNAYIEVVRADRRGGSESEIHDRARRAMRIELKRLLNRIIAQGRLLLKISEYHEYKRVIGWLFDNPDLVSTVMPNLAQVHPIIFDTRDALKQFIRDLGQQAYRWVSMLTHEMQVALIPLCAFNDFLNLFPALIQQELLFIFKNELFRFILINDSLDAFLSIEHSKLIITLSNLARLIKHLQPQYLAPFSAAMQSYLLITCSAKLQLHSLADIHEWMRHLLPENRPTILNIAKSTGMLDQSLHTHVDLIELLSGLEQPLQALLLRHLAPLPPRLIPRVDALEQVLSCLLPLEQTQLVSAFQPAGFFRGLNLDNLNAGEKYRFIQLWLELFQFKQQAGRNINSINHSPVRFFLGEQIKKHQLVLHNAGLSWLQRRLLGCAEPFDTLPFNLRETLLGERLLCQYRIQVEGFVGLLANVPSGVCTLGS